MATILGTKMNKLLTIDTRYFVELCWACSFLTPNRGEQQSVSVCGIIVRAYLFGCSFLSVEISGPSFSGAVLQNQNKSLDNIIVKSSVYILLVLLHRPEHRVTSNPQYWSVHLCYRHRFKTMLLLNFYQKISIIKRSQVSIKSSLLQRTKISTSLGKTNHGLLICKGNIPGLIRCQKSVENYP